MEYRYRLKIKETGNKTKNENKENEKININKKEEIFNSKINRYRCSNNTIPYDNEETFEKKRRKIFNYLKDRKDKKSISSNLSYNTI